MRDRDIQTAVVSRVRELESNSPPAFDDEIDLSSPEAERVLQAVSRLLLEVRQDIDGRLARRVRLYEATLGLAVVPVLLRRGLKKSWAEWRGRRAAR
jgi:hypothetical protein